MSQAYVLPFSLSRPFSQGTLVPWKGKQYVENKSWEEELATRKSLVLSPYWWTGQRNACVNTHIRHFYVFSLSTYWKSWAQIDTFKSSEVLQGLIYSHILVTPFSHSKKPGSHDPKCVLFAYSSFMSQPPDSASCRLTLRSPKYAK